jgi:hypothetical protein
MRDSGSRPVEPECCMPEDAAASNGDDAFASAECVGDVSLGNSISNWEMDDVRDSGWWPMSEKS